MQHSWSVRTAISPLRADPGTLAKGLAGAHFGEKDQIALKDKAVE
jgi:hypothetical protein